MSNTNGVAYRDKSMNGVITISDGGGTTISNGTITANTLKINELTTNTIKSTTPSATVNAYISNTGNVNIGGATSTLKLSNTIEPFSTVSPVNLFPSASNIVVGNETDIVKVSKYEFIGDDIVGMTNSDTTRLFNNLTDGELNIAPSLTTGTCTVGSATSANKVGRFTFNDFFINFDDPFGYVACFDDAECYFGDYSDYCGIGTSSKALNLGNFQFEESYVRLGSNVNTNYVGRFTFFEDAITSNAVDSAITMFDNITTGSLEIATGLTSGVLTLGNDFNANSVGKFDFIGDDMLSNAVDTATTMMSNITTGSLEIGTGLTTGALTLGNATNTNTVGNFNLIGDALTSSAVSSATTLMSNITTGSVKLGAGITTGFTNIGESLTTGFLNLGSSASVASTGGVRIWKPLYLLYTSLPTLATNQVGYAIIGTGTVNQVTTTVTTIRQMVIPSGVWLVKARARVNGIGCQFVKLYISNQNNGTSAVNEYIISGSGINETAGQFVAIFTVSPNPITRYMTMSADATYPLTNPGFEALRIA
jgi:hypothetical protein